MMKPYLLLLLFVILSNSISAQRNERVNGEYFDISTIPVAQDAKTTAGFSGPGHPFFGFNRLDMGLYAFNTFVGIYLDKKRGEIMREETAGKLQMINAKYRAQDSYPDSIIEGWHDVIVTDNIAFCNDAKVRVSGNRIMEFVIDNSIRLDFVANGKIKDAKGLVTLKSFDGQKMKMAEVLFINDLEEPILTDQPLGPGIVTFYSSDLAIRIKINGRLLEPFTKSFDGSKQVPMCGDVGTVSLVLPPGGYTFQVERRGADYSSTFEAKSGKCLLLQVR